ncbi:MAG: 1-deoxy-D-xylulose-5-phosphate reductoisomerase [Candidatus Omnitrophota bacterium]|jgi:1-deoxy-D-xylulose-5-phosphate reductoisomerase
MKNISILGSTGSIGIRTLDIVRSHPREFCVKALAACRNVEGIYDQVREFLPEVVCLYEPQAAAELAKRLGRSPVKVVSGDDGLKTVATLSGVRQVVFAMVGARGLGPIFAALKARKSLAIANKEPLVIAGGLLVSEARRLGVEILPIDSEHSGLWQCLEGRKAESVKKLILTSSGGPFRAKKSGFGKITPASALKHPKWKMGPKITIDSATLMNKGLEVIEAANLFDVPADKVEVVIHPEAVVHAMVEFVDGTYLANLGVTDMRLPIQYALSYPRRLDNDLPALDLYRSGPLHFHKPDLRRFPCLRLGFEASRAGGSMPAVLNAANEVAVELFLAERIGFTAIPRLIERVMERHCLIRRPGLEDLLETDRWARMEADQQKEGLR